MAKKNASIEKKLPQRVYYVSCPTDRTVLIAIKPTIRNGAISWFDTNKDRAFAIKKIVRDKTDSFVFESEDGNIYSFEKMTLPIFQERVKSHLVLPMEAKSEEELIQNLEETVNCAW